MLVLGTFCLRRALTGRRARRFVEAFPRRYRGRGSRAGSRCHHSRGNGEEPVPWAGKGPVRQTPRYVAPYTPHFPIPPLSGGCHSKVLLICTTLSQPDGLIAMLIFAVDALRPTSFASVRFSAEMFSRPGP